MSCHSSRISAVLFLLAVCSMLAENPTATLVGSSATETGQIRKASTNAKGEYTAPNLPPAQYEVTVIKKDFRGVRETISSSKWTRWHAWISSWRWARFRNRWK